MPDWAVGLAAGEVVAVGGHKEEVDQPGEGACLARISVLRMYRDLPRNPTSRVLHNRFLAPRCNLRDRWPSLVFLAPRGE